MSPRVQAAEARAAARAATSGSVFPARRVHDRAGLQVPVPDALLRASDGERQPFFALTQGSLGVLLPGHVSYDHLERPVAFPGQLCADDTDVTDPSIRPDDLRVERQRRSTGPPARDAFADAAVTLRVKKIEQRSPRQLVGAVRAEKVDRRRIHERDSLILDDQDSVRR
jgi:hypothetical protein